MLLAAALYEDDVIKALEKMLFMVESVAGLKHTRAAATELKLMTGGEMDQAFVNLMSVSQAFSNKKNKHLQSVAELALKLRLRLAQTAVTGFPSSKPVVVAGIGCGAVKAAVGCARCFEGPANSKCGSCPTRYCSRECQVEDWKKGGHKVICKMKQSGAIPGPKEFGEHAKDLSKQGNQVLTERARAIAVIARLRNWDVLDCVVLVEFGAGAPRAQPIPRDEYIAHYLSDKRLGPDRATIDQQRAHTIAVMDRNRSNRGITASCHSATKCVLKTLPNTFFGGNKMTDEILEICNGDPQKARGIVAEALVERGMISLDAIRRLVNE